MTAYFPVCARSDILGEFLMSAKHLIVVVFCCSVDETVNLEESFLSSRTVTDDERDFRFILPSESHRRGLGRSRRSGSVGSDVGTVSYSSVCARSHSFPMSTLGVGRMP